MVNAGGFTSVVVNGNEFARGIGPGLVTLKYIQRRCQLNKCLFLVVG